MSSFLKDTNIKRWLKIGATDAVIENLTITDTIILPGEIVLNDVLIDKQTNVGEVNIGCLDNSSFNLQTATNGNDGEVLKTDGNGLCYWGTGNTPGSGIVFNGTTPIAETGYHTTISVDGLGLNLSKLIEKPTELNMGALDIKNANVITCFDVQTDDYFSLNQELQKIDNLGPSTTGLTDVIGTLEADSVSANYVFNKGNGSNFIEMPNNQNAIKVYTTDFLFNGEQVATIDDIPPTINQTYQQVYTNSSSPVQTTILDFKPIIFKSEEDELVMEIDGDNDFVKIPNLFVSSIQKEGVPGPIYIIGTGLISDNFVKSGGTSSQYLMADGSTTAISAIGSNIYLYSFSDNTTTPPPNGRLRFNNNTLLSSVSNVYISHITDNNIDIDPFFISIQKNNILYIQHTTTSTEWIKFTINSIPTITPENFISIPVSLLGNGTFNPPSNIFPNNTNIYFSIFSSTATTNPFNQSLNTTDNVVFNTITKQGGLGDEFLMADGSITIAPTPITQTFQQVYNNSPNPTIVEMVNGKDITFRLLEADILKIGTNFSITTPNIDTQKIEGDFYFPYNSNNLDNWSFATYNFIASSSSIVNGDHNSGRAYNVFNLVNNESWISIDDAYNLTTGLPSFGSPTTNVSGVGFVIGEYLTLFTSKPIAITGYFLGATNDNESSNPVDFQLVGSINGLTWTLLDTQVGQILSYPGKSYSFFGGSSPLTQYYRFIVNKILPNNFSGRCLIGAGTNFNIVSNPNQINLFGDVIQVVSDSFVSNNFIKNGALSTEYLMGDGSTTSGISLSSSGGTNSLISSNTNPNFSLKGLTQGTGINISNTSTAITITNSSPASAISLSSAGGINTIISTNTNPNFTFKGLTQGTGITMSNSASQIVINNASPATDTTITSTDSNLLPITGTSPNFSITPKYTYILTFGGNNTTTSAQWLQPGSNRTSTTNATNTAPFQSITPIASTITWVNIVRTLTTGTCSLAYSINSGAAVVITSLAVGVSTNPTPIATNIAVPAGASLAFSILSSATSSNILVSLLLRGT